jgi:hypothetical protein
MFNNTPIPHGATRIDHHAKTPYVHQPYPSVRFHPDGTTVEVKNEEEDALLGEPWARSPFPPPPPAPKPEPPPSPRAAFATLRDEHEALARYSAEKATEAMSLREELGAAKEELAAAKAELEAAAKAIAELREQLAQLTENAEEPGDGSPRPQPTRTAGRK